MQSNKFWDSYVRYIIRKFHYVGQKIQKFMRRAPTLRFVRVKGVTGNFPSLRPSVRCIRIYLDTADDHAKIKLVSLVLCFLLLLFYYFNFNICHRYIISSKLFSIILVAVYHMFRHNANAAWMTMMVPEPGTSGYSKRMRYSAESGMIKMDTFEKKSRVFGKVEDVSFSHNFF